MTDTTAERTDQPGPNWLRSIAGDGPTMPLIVLFGLNAVDELDRSAAAILAPEIREYFGLSLAVYFGFVGLVAFFALVSQPAIAGMADRYPRIRLALAGAVLLAFFSFTTGIALGLAFFMVSRAGSGIGKAVNDPTHRSLLADWYAPSQRPKVYSFHAAANAVGAIVGPLIGGVLAYRFGWRAPFLVFALPT